LLFAGTDVPATKRLSFDFIKQNYDETAEAPAERWRIRRWSRAPLRGNNFCDASLRKEFSEFFEPRMQKVLGGPRNYKQALEGMQLCEASKAAQGADVEAYFRGQ